MYWCSRLWPRGSAPNLTLIVVLLRDLHNRSWWQMAILYKRLRESNQSIPLNKIFTALL
jgi:hypothetical protein